MTDVAVVDYGMGNLHSVAKAIEHVAPRLKIAVTSDASVVARAARVVFPGQGAMPDCVREMDARGLRGAVVEAARGKPFLGICIGLQMLFDASDEGDTPGLGLLSGRVRRFPAERMADAKGARLKVPHMGWNEVRQTQRHPLWEGISQGSRFYFVHSYFPEPRGREFTAGDCVYGVSFACAAAHDNVFAVQFHPEKSEAAGLRLLANFVSWQPAAQRPGQRKTASPTA
jgi:imidazole glycerol-phosphate synthase subunit HisH